LSYSVPGFTGFVFAKEGTATGKLWLVKQNQQLSLTTPNGIMTGCYDNNVPIFTFFFGNSTTVTTFNPTLTTTIDLLSIGIGAYDGGMYSNKIVLNGVGASFTGYAALNTSLTPSDFFVITSKFATTFS
jgi:hypothetical protein